MSTEKTFPCYACKQTFGREFFYGDSSRRSGVGVTCKVCTARKDKARWAVRQPVALTQDQRRRRVEIVAASIARHPHRQAARLAVKAAKAAGTLVPWPVCAVPECEHTNPCAHHADYDSPLDVVWLCPKHHKQAHDIGKFA